MNTSTAPRSEEVLLAGLARHDAAAVQAFYTQYRHRILAIAMPIVRDDWDAEEVLQDVIWTVVRKADSFRGDSQFSTWLYRVTHNSAKMLLRKRKRVPIPTEGEALERAILDGSDDPTSLRPEINFQHRQLARRFETALDHLDPVNRDILMRVGVDGETAHEYSVDTGLSLAAVKARLHRVRHMLRTECELSFA